MSLRRISGAVAGVVLVSLLSKTYAMDIHALTRIGRNLTREEVATLEKNIEQSPGDVESRTKLLGYYFGKGFQDPSAREAKQRHVLWLIENSPESEVLSLPYAELDAILDAAAYLRGKKAWIDHLEQQPENLKLLENSSNYFLMHDRDLAIESLEKARSLNPENPQWPAALGQVYSLEMGIASQKARSDFAKKSLEQLELAYDLSTDKAREALLDRLAKSALESGETAKARKYAEQMLSQNVDGWNHGNNIHHGNLILGRIALAADDLDTAKVRLIEAGKTPGSPQLNSFGPNMTLAKELLQKGEKDVVLEYFELCSKFWGRGETRLAEWSALVEDDKIPDFRANLNY
ncbi:MAG: hypothetical protein KDA52_08535 [Planctomycetaceae bacterium]|nr:hypothetical protein [Planctomycetaceae bacterium]